MKCIPTFTSHSEVKVGSEKQYDYYLTVSVPSMPAWRWPGMEQ